MNQLTNQALIQELQSRIEAGKIEVQAKTNQSQEQSHSLLSTLGTKE